MIKLPKVSYQIALFGVIGLSAAVVHLLVVMNLVTYLNLAPLLANVFAFLIAFNVSYLGHRNLTFANMRHEKKLSLPHYFLVASSGGMMNEIMYYFILQYTQINYLIGLVFVLGWVAIYSFLLSRFWACR